MGSVFAPQLLLDHSYSSTKECFLTSGPPSYQRANLLLDSTDLGCSLLSFILLPPIPFSLFYGEPGDFVPFKNPCLGVKNPFFHSVSPQPRTSLSSCHLHLSRPPMLSVSSLVLWLCFSSGFCMSTGVIFVELELELECLWGIVFFTF